MKPKKQIPFSFVLDELSDLEPITKPMFGCTAIYIGSRITLILREKDNHPSSNGIWIATTHDHHSSLKKDFPKIKSIPVLGKSPTGWQMIRSNDPTFEESALRLCQLIRKGDGRIGKEKPAPARRK